MFGHEVPSVKFCVMALLLMYDCAGKNIMPVPCVNFSIHKKTVIVTVIITSIFLQFSSIHTLHLPMRISVALLTVCFMYN